VPIEVSQQHGLTAQDDYFKLFGQAQQSGASVRVPVTLALQGGGSRGIWQAGALAELLDADAVQIAAVFGASAGAINAAGLSAAIGRESCALHEIWSIIARGARHTLAPALWSLPTTYLSGRNSVRRAPLWKSERLESTIGAAFSQDWRAQVHTYVYATELPHSPAKPWDTPPFEFEAKPGNNLFARFKDGAASAPAHPLVKVLAASSCLPTVTPVLVGGDLFADGGVLANVPATFLQQGGALSSWGFSLMLLPTPPECMRPECEYIDWKMLELLHAVKAHLVTRSSRTFVLAPQVPLRGGLLGLVSGFRSEVAVRGLFDRGREDVRPFVAALRDFFSDPAQHTPRLRTFDLASKLLLPLPEKPPGQGWMPWVGYDFARQFK
jgi:predicted acylesterase/phospholipase RssA